MVLDHNQVISSHRNGDSRINIAQLGTPKIYASLVPQAQTRPTHSTPVEGSRSPSKFGFQNPTLQTQSQCGAKTSTFPRLQSVSSERAETHDKRVTSLLTHISKHVLRIINL
jgi:hypothetical protein